MPPTEPPVIPDEPPAKGERCRQAPCGWWESSMDLMRGLEVIEHEWPVAADCEALMSVVSFG